MLTETKCENFFIRFNGENKHNEDFSEQFNNQFQFSEICPCGNEITQRRFYNNLPEYLIILFIDIYLIDKKFLCNLLNIKGRYISNLLIFSLSFIIFMFIIITIIITIIINIIVIIIIIMAIILIQFRIGVDRKRLHID